jgi:hypothetical protein
MWNPWGPGKFRARLTSRRQLNLLARDHKISDQYQSGVR